MANVTSAYDRKMYISHVQKVQEVTGKRIIIVTCGGDGMIPITLRQFDDSGIDVNQISFMPLPYGSGNDLARILNWGGDSDEEYLASLA